MDDYKCFDAFYQEVCSYCRQLCRQSQERKANTTDETLDKVIRYIDQHFMDPDLNVASIADALGVSVKYLSVFFKEQTNCKISTYIEQKRIEHACTLLQSTEMTINDISLASGYALPHTFRVAFKKVQGVTPLEWKKSRRET